MVKRNQELRDRMKAKNVFNWELAEKLGVAESTIYRWMRHQMDDKQMAKMLAIVDTIAEEHEHGNQKEN